MTTVSLWNNNTAYITMTGITVVKAATVSLWKDTVYITMTGITLVKVTTVSLWKDTCSLYNDCFPPSQNRLPKAYPLCKVRAK